MAEIMKPPLDAINFKIEADKKQRLKEIGLKSRRDLTGQMQYLVDECLAKNPVKKPRKAKAANV